jgi:hypothetical protein
MDLAELREVVKRANEMILPDSTPVKIALLDGSVRSVAGAAFQATLSAITFTEQKR